MNKFSKIMMLLLAVLLVNSSFAGWSDKERELGALMHASGSGDFTVDLSLAGARFFKTHLSGKARRSFKKFKIDSKFYTKRARSNVYISKKKYTKSKGEAPWLLLIPGIFGDADIPYYKFLGVKFVELGYRVAIIISPYSIRSLKSGMNFKFGVERKEMDFYLETLKQLEKEGFPGKVAPPRLVGISYAGNRAFLLRTLPEAKKYFKGSDVFMIGPNLYWEVALIKGLKVFGGDMEVFNGGKEEAALRKYCRGPKLPIKLRYMRAKSHKDLKYRDKKCVHFSYLDYMVRTRLRPFVKLLGVNPKGRYIPDWVRKIKAHFEDNMDMYKQRLGRDFVTLLDDTKREGLDFSYKILTGSNDPVNNYEDLLDVIDRGIIDKDSIIVVPDGGHSNYMVNKKFDNFLREAFNKKRWIKENLK